MYTYIYIAFLHSLNRQSLTN